MTQICKVVNLPIFILFFIPHLSLALDKYFQACKPRECGGLTITYPFQIQGQQEPYCGYLGFEVTCSSKNQTNINLYNDSYIIEQISYDQQSLQMVNIAFIDSVFNCNPYLQNLTLDDKRFKFPSNYSEIFLLQNCTDKVKESLVKYTEMSCVDGNKTRILLAAYEQDINLGELNGECKTVNSVPYEGQDGGDIEGVLRKGLVLNWVVSDCSSECTDSGGRCAYNPSNSQAQCFCPDGVHTLRCPNPKYGLSFWGDDRPEFCGLQEFRLSCDNVNRNPVIDIGGQQYFGVRVLDINMASHTMAVLPFKLFDHNNLTCQKQTMNYTSNFAIPFKLGASVGIISLFYGCPGWGSTNHSKSFACSNYDGTTSFAYYADKPSEISNMSKSCATEITVPVLKRGLGELNNGNSTLVNVLEKGFEVEYVVNFRACSTCEQSGGRCGSSDGIHSKFLCYCPDGNGSVMCSNKSGGSKLAIKLVIIGSVAGVSGLGILVLIALVTRSNRIQSAHKSTAFLWTRGTIRNQNVEAFLKSYGTLASKRYTFTDIRKMTNSFKDKLGEGGYGCVYKGKLRNGRFVAVKLLKKSKGNGEEFINEVVSISRTNHVNIVTLLGFCFEGKKRALVYDFLTNGSLEKFMYGASTSQSLPWETLFNIVVGIARGLDYLHRGCNTRILHFDIKPHNILLDEEFKPKISDFGLARLCPQKGSTISMSEGRGTIGYIAPEVFCRNFGRVSHKSDVYSYGMMVLDIVCGRKNISAEVRNHHSSELYFPEWIYSRLELGEEVEVDGIMNDDEKELQRKMILVSLWCIQTYPSNRPTMSRVVEMLEGCVEALQMPPKPYYSSPPRFELDSSSIPTITT